jgi:hypothetical protein
VHLAEAARLAGLRSTVALRLKELIGARQVEADEAGLPPPTLEELVARNPGSGAKEKIMFKQVTDLLSSGISLQRKKDFSTSTKARLKRSYEHVVYDD